MFTPAFFARDGETCATPASARGAPAATLRHSSACIRYAGDRATRPPRSRRSRARAPARRSAATFPRRMPRGEPMALDVAPSSFSSHPPARATRRAVAHARAVRLGAGGRRDSEEAEPRSAIVFAAFHGDGRAPSQTRRLGEGAACVADVGEKAKFFSTPRTTRTPRTVSAQTLATRERLKRRRVKRRSRRRPVATRGTPSCFELCSSPRTIRADAEPSLRTVPSNRGGRGGDGGRAVVARQLFDEAQTQRRGRAARACPYGDLEAAQQNKAARSSLAMRSSRKPAETATSRRRRKTAATTVVSRRALERNRLASDAGGGAAERRSTSTDSRSRRATCRRVTRQAPSAPGPARCQRGETPLPRRRRPAFYAARMLAECRATVCRETVVEQAETSMMSMSHA